MKEQIEGQTDKLVDKDGCFISCTVLWTRWI